MSTKKSEVQFLLTLDVKDLALFEKELKSIQYRILLASKEALLRSNNDGAVKIDRIK